MKQQNTSTNVPQNMNDIIDDSIIADENIEL